MSAIFISYRRSGAKQTAYRLKDKLKQAFGGEKVFLDLEDIRAGAHFASVIRDTIAQASVVLVIIGPKWMEMEDSDGQRRLDEQDDWVRQEVESALQSDAKVIPVLVDGATEIDVQRLPESMRDLASRNFLEISAKETHWHFDTDRLIDAIRHADPGLGKAKPDKQLPLSNKGIWSLVLLVLLVFGLASEEDAMADHDTMIGGIVLAILALVLGIWALFDVRAERVRGMAMAIGAIAMGGLATLGLIGSLPGAGDPEIHAALPAGDPREIDLNALPPTAAAPRVPVTPSAVEQFDVSGTWVSAEGMFYRIVQEGDSIAFDEFDLDGELSGSGRGRIQGNRIDAEFESSDEGPGRTRLIIAGDGQSMSGSYHLSLSGESGQSVLYRR